ncbi:YbaB/EbfC family nucleoid-associated protein [Nocardia sp. SC052]|uniref:YbaB/EbfC family nucleoid-associated protein n=1 Tax=Nocardia sichangensis TaxID=3385975 RepID=UPI0039A1DA3F
MDRWEREGLRSANYGMRNQIDHMLDALTELQARIPEAQDRLAAARATGSSADGLVEVTVDSTGKLTDVGFKPEALRGTPERLSESVREATRHAVARAQEQTQEIMAPIVSAAGNIPDLPDLVPGAPSLRTALDSEPGPLSS